MKKLSTLFLAILVASAGWAQKQKVASQSRLTKVTTYHAKLQQLLKANNEDYTGANKVSPIDYDDQTPAVQSTALSPVGLGRASNVYTHLRQEQNNVYANNDLNMVVYLHRQDVTIWGGGGSQNGKLRYDVSIDGGLSFSTDVGPVNNTYTRPSRYPNITGYNSTGTSNPLETELVWMAPTLDPQPDWDGHVAGVSAVATSGFPTTTENYNFLGQNTLLPGGLCEGAAGVFWAVDSEYNGSSDDSIFVYKGVYNSGTSDVDWTRHFSFAPGHFTAANNGTSVLIGPNISTSPDGMDVWVGWLGDIVGGHDSLLSPCFMHSADGGNTWDTTASEVDLRTIPWIADSLTSFWVSIDSVTGDTTPAGSGRPTCGFDFDMTVDANGNPHLSCIIGNGTSPGGDPPAYSIFSGINKFLIDVYTDDGGTTWDATYMAPILTFRGEFGTPDPSDGSLLSMDNVVQVSRTPDGNRIFFSFVDSDTSVIGFGESDNIAPNLRIAAKRITDGHQTCFKRITDGDQNWDGRILYPSMAPEVLTSSTGNRHFLPIVFLNMISNDQLGPTEFLYLGNDAQILETDFMDPAMLNLAFDGNCFPVFVGNEEELNAGISVEAFPNPTSGNATIRVELDDNEEVSLTLTNLYGQQIETISDGFIGAGSHDFVVNTSDLASGIYLYSLKAGERVITKKLIVTK